jgi:putative ABC transport system permease protein
MSDLRFACRQMLRNPGFTAVAVLTLALGIAATSTVFSVINGFLFPALPFREPGKLSVLMERDDRRDSDLMGVSVPNFFEIAAATRTVEQMAIMTPSSVTLLGAGEPQRIFTLYASPNLFALLGVMPHLGRGFLPEEDQPGGRDVVVVTHKFWQTKLGGNPAVVGSDIVLSGRSCTVVGVMPAGFEFPLPAEVCRALRSRTDNSIADRGERASLVLARLKAGTRVSQARAEMRVLARQLTRAYPESNTDVGLKLVSLLEWGATDYIRLLRLVFCGVACLLLIACANVGNLQLARVTARQKEIAMRMSIGASRGRMIRQLLSESILLSLLGGGLGVVLTYWGRGLIEAWFTFGANASPTVDLRVVGLSILTIGLTALLCGLAPALQGSTLNLFEVLKDNSSQSSSRRGRRLRSALVIAEVALAFTLLVGGSLALKSFVRWRTTDLGFKPDNMLTLYLELPEEKYGSDEAMRFFTRGAIERLEGLPMIRGAALSSLVSLPIEESSGSKFTVRDGSNVRGKLILAHAINANFFDAMEIPVVAGRTFTDRDGSGSEPVAIINERLASHCWPGAPAVGRQLKLGGSNTTNSWLTIVGVARNVRHPGWLDVSEGSMDIYVPFPQQPSGALTFRVRVEGELKSALPAVRQALLAIDRDQPVAFARSLEEGLRGEGESQRGTAGVLSAFAFLAVALAGVGIYGVVSCLVGERRREMGIRMALGAQRSQVGKCILTSALVLILSGIAIGLALGLGLTRLMAGLLFGVSVLDPLVFSGVAVCVTLVGLLAALLPARRATKVSPVEALRHE